MFRNLSTVGLPLSGRPSELIELALSFGFDAMDIDLIDFQQQADVYGVEHARRLMVSARLKSGVFQLPVRLSGEEADFREDLKHLPRRLELAAATEAPRAVTTLAPASDDRSFKENLELHVARLQEIAALLAPHRILLGLALRPEAEARSESAHAFIHTYEGLLGLLAVAPPQVGVVIDAWALQVTGEPVDLVGRVPAGRIVEIRLSDAPRGTRGADLVRADRLMPGETGVIPAAPLLSAARAAGFDGPVTPWADRATLVGRGREKIVRLAGERMEQTWREAGLPILPRWFAPVPRDQFGRPIEESAADAAATA